MRARFIGDPQNGGEGPVSLSLFGLTFTRDEWTDVPKSFAAKIKGNTHFEVEAVAEPEGEDVAALQAALDAKGIPYHRLAGAKKLKALLDKSEA